MVTGGPVEAYKALTPSSSRAQVAAVLDSIISASPTAFDSADRAALITSILGDLSAIGSSSRLSAKDSAKALLAVKTLGRDPSGSEVIAEEKNILKLLHLQTSLKDYPDATTEALRCIANALLLVDSARSRFLEGEGGNICMNQLEKTVQPDQIFINSRILFLATAAGSLHIQTMVESKFNGRQFPDILASKIDSLVKPIQTGVPLAREAMTDILKFVFNIMLYYPKQTESETQNEQASQSDTQVYGDYWDSKLSPLLAPLLRVFLSLPPTSPCPVAPPLTHVINNLIGIPVLPSLKSVWFGRSSSPGSGKSSGQRSSQPGSRNHSPNRSGQSSPVSPKPSTFDRAMAVLSGTRRSISRSSSPVVTHCQVVDRALELLDTTLARYLPGDIEVDDVSVRTLVKNEGAETLDDLLSPLTILITRLCIADEACRLRVREYIVPADLDRSSPLEQRKDILGRCLRLLGSVYHSRLKSAIGEMLYAASDSNASTLSALVGYGNVAGFLYGKNIMSAPPQASASSDVPTTTASGEAINPITGTTVQPKSSLPDMTEEEKEREMEKLLVIFDRLERSGNLPRDQNPIRKAIHEGKFANS